LKPSHRLAATYLCSVLLVLTLSLLSSTGTVGVAPILPVFLSGPVALVLFSLLPPRSRVARFIEKPDRLGVPVAIAATASAANSLARRGIMWTHDLTGNALPFLPLFRHLVWRSPGVPRWVHNIWCGVPCLRFYPPLVSWVSALIPLPDATQTVKAVIALSFFLSAAAMYKTARAVIGSRSAAVFSAFCYTLFGYHLLDVFVRGDLSEGFSFVWMPLVFLLFWRSLRGGDGLHRNSILCGLALALLILTHVLIGLLQMAWLLIYSIMLVVARGVRAKGETGLRELSAPLRSCGICFAVGLTTTAFFLIPALVEIRYATISTYGFSGWFNPFNHFISVGQVIHRIPWSASLYPMESPRLPMYLGNVVLFTALTSALTLRRRDHAFWALYVSGVFLLLFPTTCLVPLVRALYVQPASHLLDALQFPWRSFAILGFVASLLAGYGLQGILERLGEGNWALKRALLCLLIFALMVDMYPYTGAVKWEDSLHPGGSVDAALGWVCGQPGVHRIWSSEASYLMILSSGHYPLLLDGPYYDWKPAGHNLMFKALQDELVGSKPLNVTSFLSVKYIVTKSAALYGTDGFSIECLFGDVCVLENRGFRPLFEVLDNTTDVEANAVGSDVSILEFSSERMECLVRVTDGSPSGRYYLTVKEGFFPGWQARVGGVDRPVLRTKNGLMAVEVPPEVSRVEIIFRRTEAEIYGQLISVSSFVLIFLGLIGKRARLSSPFCGCDASGGSNRGHPRGLTPLRRQGRGRGRGRRPSRERKATPESYS